MCSHKHVKLTDNEQEEVGPLLIAVLEAPCERLNSPHFSQGCFAGVPQAPFFFPRFGFIDNMLTEKIDVHKGSGGLMQAVIIDFPSADDEKAYY